MKPSPSTPHRKARAAMTPKQRVLKKYPHAVIGRHGNGLYAVMPSVISWSQISNDFSTPAAAWADAARHL